MSCGLCDDVRMTASPPRKRRSSTQVRALITAAAYEEFALTGLEGTSIRSVAERAGVTESMVFRHFSSKNELFQATAAGPLVQFMYEFAANVATRADEQPEAVTFRFISGLYDLCMDNRRILLSLAVHSAGSSPAGTEPAFEECLNALVRGVNKYIGVSTSRASRAITDSVRMALSLVLGATLSGNDLFPRDTDPDTIKHMLADFVLLGAGYISPDQPA